MIGRLAIQTAGVLLWGLFLSAPVAAGQPVVSASTETQPNDTSCVLGSLAAGVPIEIAQQGCCSWHQGVCGCYGSRVVCCDNTMSPSCTCRGGSQGQPNASLQNASASQDMTAVVVPQGNER